MSYSATRWAKAQPRLRGSRKAVLTELADRANDDGICFPSLKRLADDLGYGVRTMASAVQELLRRRYIVKVEDRAERETLLTRAGARFVSLRVNVYRILSRPEDVAAREAAEAELGLELPHQRRPRHNGCEPLHPTGANLCTPAAEPAPAVEEAPETPADAAKSAPKIMQIRPVHDAISASESSPNPSIEPPPRNPPAKRGGRRARRVNVWGEERERAPQPQRNGFVTLILEEAERVIDLQRAEWAAVP